MNAFRFLPATVTARSLHRFGHSLFSVVLFFFLIGRRRRRRRRRRRSLKKKKEKGILPAFRIDQTQENTGERF